MFDSCGDIVRESSSLSCSGRGVFGESQRMWETGGVSIDEWTVDSIIQLKRTKSWNVFILRSYILESRPMK